MSGMVRYVDFRTEPITPAMQTSRYEKAGLVKKAKVGKGYIRVITCDDLYEFLKTKLQNNCFYLAKRRPKFEKDKVPLI